MSDDGGIGKHDDKLHACIRELEAELADVRTYGAAAKYKARAEKAERELNDANNRLNAAQARVAELEEQRLFDSRNYEPEREAD